MGPSVCFIKNRAESFEQALPPLTRSFQLSSKHLMGINEERQIKTAFFMDLRNGTLAPAYFMSSNNIRLKGFQEDLGFYNNHPESILCIRIPGRSL
jgi:hypothetical protein